MAELAFEQQVILTLLDKGLFAAIGIALTVWGLRLVEGYKAKEATRLEATKAGETLRVEVTKEKVKKIEAIWSEFSDLETELTRIVWDTSQVRGEAIRQLAEGGQLKPGPKGLPADERAIEEIAIPQLKLEILPRILQLEARRQQIRHKIDVVDRFWLGATIASDLLARTNIYGNIFDRLKAFEPSPFEGVPKLSERDDVDRFVDALLKKADS
jgi:hypothetical protein